MKLLIIYFKLFFAAAFLLVSSTIVFADDVPNIGSPHSKYLSPQQEAEIGRQMMQRVRESTALITDPEINSYIQSIGNRLVNSSEDNNLPQFTFFIIASNQINAFAAPGGYIGLFTGLINATKTESELAAVIAHEIGHITQKHIARRIAEQERLSVPRIAALLASILIATQDSEAGAAAMISTNAASIQHQLSYSRTAEKEADNVGLKLLAKTGYNPNGMTDFFETLQDEHSLSGKPIEYLSTHPLTTNRISEIKARINPNFKWQGKDSSNYSLIKTKLDINQITDPDIALKKYEQLVLKNNNFQNRYGYALALIKSEKYSKAEKIALQLIKDDAERIAYIIALGKSQLKQSKFEQCYKTYKKGFSIYPENYPLIHHYAVALLYSKSYSQGLEFIKQRLNIARSYPSLFKLAADLASKDNKEWLAHEYMGDYYLFNFNQPGLAREHYRKSITNAHNSLKSLQVKEILLSRIESKIEKINKLEQEIKNNQ